VKAGNSRAPRRGTLNHLVTKSALAPIDLCSKTAEISFVFEIALINPRCCGEWQVASADKALSLTWMFKVH